MKTKLTSRAFTELASEKIDIIDLKKNKLDEDLNRKKPS